MILANLGQWLLAAADDANPNPGGGGSLWQFLPTIAIGMLLFYLLILMPDRKKQKAQQQLLGNLKKNDRVVTIGGIYGVVVNVQKESDEVTIKVDEATNTKLRMTIGSISRVIVEAPAGDQPAKS